MKKWFSKSLRRKGSVGQTSPTTSEIYYADDKMAFRCTYCENPVGFPLAVVDRGIGKCIQCEMCNNVFHAPGAVRRHDGESTCPHDIAVVAGVRMEITQLPDWYLNHPTTKALVASGDGDLHVHYGLYANCASCYHEYSHNILSTFAIGQQAAGFVFNAHSKVSADDMNALNARACPKCSSSAILCIVSEVPDYVREELKRMGRSD